MRVSTAGRVLGVTVRCGRRSEGDILQGLKESIWFSIMMTDDEIVSGVIDAMFVQIAAFPGVAYRYEIPLLNSNSQPNLRLTS